jgi:hypothetical protein
VVDGDRRGLALGGQVGGLDRRRPASQPSTDSQASAGAAAGLAELITLSVMCTRSLRFGGSSAYKAALQPGESFRVAGLS